jgi:hypothetical protein
VDHSRARQRVRACAAGRSPSKRLEETQLLAHVERTRSAKATPVPSSGSLGGHAGGGGRPFIVGDDHGLLGSRSRGIGVRLAGVRGGGGRAGALARRGAARFLVRDAIGGRRSRARFLDLTVQLGVGSLALLRRQAGDSDSVCEDFPREERRPQRGLAVLGEVQAQSGCETALLVLGRRRERRRQVVRMDVQPQEAGEEIEARIGVLFPLPKLTP